MRAVDTARRSLLTKNENGRAIREVAPTRGKWVPPCACQQHAKMGTQRKSRNYEDFVEKFKAKRTTDDCFTPANIYEVVRDWAVRKYRITGEIVRPFWPGKDYTKVEYPAGCCVIDNPPFSICKKIVDWYNAHGVRFFIFCPGLSSLSIARDGKTTFISVGNTITFENGAKVNIGFLTNMCGDVLCETASDLHDLIKKTNDENEKEQKKHVTMYSHAENVLTAGRLNFLAVHHTPFKVMRKSAAFVRELDSGARLFGGGFFLARSLMLAAAERAAAERAAAHVITLSEREKIIIKELG